MTLCKPKDPPGPVHPLPSPVASCAMPQPLSSSAGGLHLLGVNILAIVASLGVLALIVGFAADSIIADLVTGVFILFDSQYNVGDIIEVDGFRGVVTDIGIRTTSITDASENIKIVNNADMRNILNRSGPRVQVLLRHLHPLYL